jgi:hypothetical protein
MHWLEIGTRASHTGARFGGTVDAGWRVERLSPPLGVGCRTETRAGVFA